MALQLPPLSLTRRVTRVAARSACTGALPTIAMVARVARRPQPSAPPCPYRACGPARGGVACSSGKKERPLETDPNTVILAIGALLLAGAATVVLSDPMVQDSIEEFVYDSDVLSSSSFFGPTDVAAGLLWGLSLFYASPLQQLFLFLGKIEVARPSDWIIMSLARGPLGMDIMDVNEAPGWLSGVAAGVCVASGFGISYLLLAGLGDSIWALSTGTGACLAAGVYEVGRPTRMNKEEAQELDEQWRDFVTFANERMVRMGRCHESEIVEAFRKQNARYRSDDALPAPLVRSLVRNWAPDADRTPNGYYRGVSLRPRVNEFTGKVEGGSAVAELVGPAVVAAGTQAGGVDAAPAEKL